MATRSPWPERGRQAAAPSPPRLALPAAERPPAEPGGASAAALNGAAAAIVPIPVPAARGAPALSLAYSQGLENGPFGLGFGLDVPSIARATHLRIPRYEESDLFTGPGGELLTPGLRREGGGWTPYAWEAEEGCIAYEVRVYRPRRDAGAERIERWSAPDGACFWKVRDGEGGTAVLGRSAGARIADPRDPARVARWLLEEKVDALGNLVRYSYKGEDGAGWSGWTPAGGFAQRYPAAIAFSNYEAGGETAFAFEVIFDYGEYEPPASLEPVRPWPVRADPLTDCRAGFPIQTLRLCRNVLTVNRLPETGAPHATSVLQLGYEEDPVHSRLVSARLLGVRGEGEGAETAALPPLRLSYAGFSPADAEWHPIALPDGSPPPAPLGGEGPAALVLADLRGEGLPGLLATDPDNPLYFPPLGDGVIGAGEPLDRYPDVGSGGARFSWEDVEGGGRLSPVLMTDSVRGYFPGLDGNWQPYRPFGAVPEEAFAPGARWADVDGDGRADLLVQLTGNLRCYLDEGAEGFGPPLAAPAASGFPVLDGDQRSAVLFADVLGDGLAHCVRVRDGAVEVWPNLGYGHFGAPYAMEGAPALGPELRADRILLADLTGSGRADLALLYPDRVEIHRNRSGLGFLPPLEVPIPGGLDPLDRVDISDVEGIGLDCLAIARAGPDGGTSYLRLRGEEPAFLLTGCANGIGATTSFSYRSSTEFYLADRQAGRPWRTRLANPVTVVARVEHRDEVSGVATVETRQYRDGWYDPVERVFRGFGSVQAQDTTGLHPDLWCFPDDDAPAAPNSRLVRQWFDVAGGEDGGSLERRFRGEQFDPGPQGVRTGPTAMLPPIAEESGRTLREAMASPTGLLLHTEVYALDEDGLPAPVPLNTEDHAYAVEMLQPARGEENGSFRVLGRESVTTSYEGVGGDPRIEQDALLGWDDYGFPTSWASVFYPRRSPEIPPQEELRAVLHEQAHVAVDDAETFLTGLTWEERQSELGGLDRPAGGAFDYATLATQVALATASANRVPYGSPFAGGPQSRTFAAAQTIFWNDELSAPAPLGAAVRRGLVHHGRDAVFPASFPERAYGGRVDAAMLTAEAGLYEDAGFWWRDGTTISYLGPAGFFAPRAFRTPFQTEATETTVTYDAYNLFSLAVTDGYGFEQTAQPDYEAMQPGTVTDVNGVLTQGIYDPLGRLAAIAQHARAGAGYLGDMDLANYRRRLPPSLEELIADPGAYLQGARMYFLHALETTDPGRAQVAMASVQATAYVGAPNATEPAAAPLVTVTHLDGFGRTLEALERVEGAAAGEAGEWTWASRRRVDYDDRGRILRSYLPTFLPDWELAEPGARPYSEFAFDALYREVREDEPKGFFEQTTHNDPWSERHHDADDTVTESRYYREHIDDPSLPPAERRALEMAAGFAGTPRVTKLDPQGFAVEEDVLDVLDGKAVAYPTRLEVDIRGLVTAVADPRLGPEHPNVVTEFDMLGRPLHVRRVDAGETFQLHDAMDRLVREWTPQDAVVATAYDTVIRRPVEESVEAGGGRAVTKRFAYGTERAKLSVNRLVCAEDQAGRCETLEYDLLGHAAAESWRFARQFEGTLDWSAPGGVELLAQTWTCRWERDPAGRLSAEHCADGSVLRYERYRNGWLRGAGVDGPAPAAVGGCTFLAGGQPTSAAYVNGFRLAWDHDPLTLELIRARATGPSTLQDLTYTLDPAGNVCAIEDRAAAAILGGSPQTLVKELGYDALYRLQQASGWQAMAGLPWQPYEERYHYDEAENLLAVESSVGGKQETRAFARSPSSNRAVLATMAGPGHPVDSFFDAAGNLLSDETGARFAYDYEQRLAAASSAVPGEADAWYRYDHDGLRRRRRVAGGGTVVDLFQVGSASLAVGAQQTASSVLCQGHAGGLFLAERESLEQPPALRYLVPDRLGSVTAEVDAVGGLLRYEDFLPYGEVSARAGTGAAPAVVFGFSGKAQDPETNFDYFGARHYKPNWGRWLTPDPLREAGGLNLYAYVEGNPVSRRDPHGYGPIRRTGNVAARLAAAGPYRRSPRLAQSPLTAATVTAVAPSATVSTAMRYGTGADFYAPGFGGDIIQGTTPTGDTYSAGRWQGQVSNSGVGLARNYPDSSANFQAPAGAVNIVLTGISVNAAGNVTFIRGHVIPHADTMRNTPASGGALSTSELVNYIPELQGWGPIQRARREIKGRSRGTPMIQIAEYDPSPSRTGGGHAIPARIYLIELTGLSTEQGYAAAKGYNVKAYKVEYDTFDYQSLNVAASSNRTRRELKTLRIHNPQDLPPYWEQVLRHESNVPAGFTPKL